MSEQRKLPDWISEHMDRYLETNGEDGHIWRGVPTLLLTTIGRRTGAPLTLPLIYGEYEDAYVVVASKGGHKNHPTWYLNLLAQPQVQVQVAGDKFSARARTANAEEKPELWQQMSKIWPSYNEYQEKTTREIPVVILQRISSQSS